MRDDFCSRGQLSATRFFFLSFSLGPELLTYLLACIQGYIIIKAAFPGCSSNSS
jgi:hypothetical protein